jgi:signal peptidase I
MVPTLRDGDFILVSKLSYGLRLPFFKETLWRYDSPERGEVVVFTRPDEPETTEDESAINIVKRIVGIGGDRISLRARQLYLNGEPLEEPHVQYTEPFFYGGEFQELIVPEGTVFLLGDNRDQSKDSRFWETPFLPLELVKGRALFIYWSWYDLGRIGKVIR